MPSEAQPPALSPSDPDPLRCDVSRNGDHAHVRLVGELDLATVPHVEARLAELQGAGVKRVVLDLSGLRFLDSTGLCCILEHDAAARRDGFSMALVPGPPAVQRVFELTGTEQRLPFVDG
jgi:anti-sigma B factor antagonist